MKTIKSLPKMLNQGKAKEFHKLIQGLLKTGKSSPLIEGITSENNEILLDQREVHLEILRHFKTKYLCQGIKNRFEGVTAPNIILSKEEFERITKKINPKKGNGYDYVPLAILKRHGGKELMHSVVNETLSQEIPEKRLFDTRLVLLSKTGSKVPKASETRPIAITTLPQKILEHLLLERLEKELGSHIAKSQFGFRSKRETLMHVVRLIDRLQTRTKNKPKRMSGCLIFVDFSTAFDTIEHHLLLEKIEGYKESSEETVNLLKWYLNAIHLKLDNSTIYQNRGSPQGGIASPFLWLIYINDLLLEIEQLIGTRNTYAFADDLLFYCTNFAVAEIVVRKVLQWSRKNKITVNLKKSAILPLARRKMKNDSFSNRNILNIPYVKEYKYLGLVIDYTMRFERTINQASRLVSMLEGFGILGHEILSVNQKLAIWKTYFNSKLMYPIMTLLMISKSAVKKITSQVSMSLKKALNINIRMEKEKLFGWLYELLPLEAAELSFLRTVKKLTEADLQILNQEFFINKITAIPRYLTESFLKGEIGKKELKSTLLENRGKKLGFRGGKPLDTLENNDLDWLKMATGELDLFRWKGKLCALCKENLTTKHLLTCKKTYKIREEIEVKSGIQAEVAIMDPSVFNSKEKQEKIKIKSFIASRVNNLINSAGRELINRSLVRL